MSKIIKFNYKTCTYNKFKKRWEDLKKAYPDIKKLHKYRILNYYGLSLKYWKSELQKPDVIDWKRKLEYIEYKLEQFYLLVIDNVIENEGYIEIFNKEQNNIFENPEQNQNTQAIQINLNKQFTLPENVKIDNPIELELK